jgi:CheY-like chemotaxis protein
MRVTLVAEGYDVATARDAAQALETVAQKKPRLILMDLQLPGIDGLELTRRLRASPDTCDVPIVAVTSFAMTHDRDAALAAGCDDYIPKPVDTRKIPAMVARFVGSGRPR